MVSRTNRRSLSILFLSPWLRKQPQFVGVLHMCIAPSMGAALLVSPIANAPVFKVAEYHLEGIEVS
jgi:hypothetical protein